MVKCSPCRQVKDFVALRGQHGVQLFIRQRPIALLNLPLQPVGLHRWCISASDTNRQPS